MGSRRRGDLLELNVSHLYVGALQALLTVHNLISTGVDAVLLSEEPPV